MMNNLKEIQTYIKSENYCNHPGKNADFYYQSNIGIEDYQQLASLVSQQGFVVINTKNNTLRKILTIYAKAFGKQVKDVGINKKYIAKVAAEDSGMFYINTSISQPLHTDEGYDIKFPRYVSLYCIRPSNYGGISTIVKLNELLSYLYQQFGDEIDNLFKSDFIKINTKQGLKNKQLLFQINPNLIGISYSPMMRDFKTSPMGYKIISAINLFTHDPLNQYRIALKENDLLIMDNCQVLHGRTAFNGTDNRLLLRLWNKQITS